MIMVTIAAVLWILAAGMLITSPSYGKNAEAGRGNQTSSAGGVSRASTGALA
jgi:hypothetical protein